jgi:hypothetical protein
MFLAESMQAVSFTERRAQGYYRHELRTLTYVTIDDANGGIIRNINHEGVALQAVGALRSQQRVRLRFEMRFPRLRIDAYGQVSWASPTGQCGIQFLDLPASTRLQIDRWIFSNLLDAMAREASRPRSMFARSVFGGPVVSIGRARASAGTEEDGLTVSSAVRTAIRLEPEIAAKDYGDPLDSNHYEKRAEFYEEISGEGSWLSRPLSGRSLALVVDGLVVTAALLMFAFIFLSIAHELPPWPLTVGTGLAAAAFVAGTYWSVFTVFQGVSLGRRLAAVHSSREGKDEAVRIR